jgi:methionyl-tRNA formyltransferase
MKIAIIFYNENHFHPDFFDGVLSRACGENTPCEVVGAVFTNAKINLHRTIRLAGICGCFKLAINMIVKKITRVFTKPYLNSCIKTFKHYSIDIIECDSPNEDVVPEYIKDKEVDVIFNFAPHILKKEILSSPKLMCVNRHASLLPKYRGVEPVFWAMLNNESNVGYSYHEMNEKIDDGKVIFQEEHDVSGTDTVYSLYKKLFNKSIEGFFNTLENLKENKFVSPEVQIEDKVWRYPSIENIRKFRQKRRYI